MHHVPVLLGNASLHSRLIRIACMAHVRAGLRDLCHAQCHVVQHWKWRPTFVQCWKCLSFCRVESQMNILVVKSTADTRLKDATMITIASFDAGRLKKSLKDEQFYGLAVFWQ